MVKRNWKGNPTMSMRLMLAAFIAMTLPASANMAPPPRPEPPPIPAGAFTLDKAHASLILGVSHLGFSNYRMRFSTFDVALAIDPMHPGKASATVTVDATSLTLDNAPTGFREELLGKNWINAVTFPKIVFKTTKVDLRSATTALVSGDLTMNGATKPVSMYVTYNGGYATHPMDPGPRIGFSGSGTFKRSDFGIKAGIPAPGTKMGVGDEVTFSFEMELKGKTN